MSARPSPHPNLPPRLKDWQARLTAYLTEVSRSPFEPGRQDCALFAAGAVAAQVGTDPAQDWRGRYRSIPAGLKALRRAGLRDHVDLCSQLLPEVHPAFAAAGDICLVDGEGGQPALGVVQGECLYVLRRDGLGLLPRGAMLRAWRV